MKKILIVSPNFPPVNTPDLHRVRQSLPYLEKYGWAATILTVYPSYIEAYQDELLEESIQNCKFKLIKTKAFSSKYTRKVGLGDLGLRSLLFLFIAGRKELLADKYDLVYFSSTVFATFILGMLWKKIYKVPFIIDMQDPWRNDYYLQLPKKQRPPKYWFAHRMHSFLEKHTIPFIDGIISVNSAYIKILETRYKLNFKNKLILPFSFASKDLEIAKNKISGNKLLFNNQNNFNIVYTGVIPDNMLPIIKSILHAFKVCREIGLYKNIKFYFIGTNYAVGSKAHEKLGALVEEIGFRDIVIEQKERMAYFEALKHVVHADMLLIPGTLDKDYIPSKIFPYVTSGNTILALLHEASDAINILQQFENAKVFSFKAEHELEETSVNSIATWLKTREANPKKVSSPEIDFAEDATIKQVNFFHAVLSK